MKLRLLTAALTAAGLFSACGGGGSTDSGAAVTPAKGVTLTGVVAKGAALAGATVTAKCATGTGTARAGADGGYTFTVADGVLPCVLQAVAADKSITLHSVATGDTSAASTSATANITTLTELLVAQVLGTEPAAFFADTASVATLSTAVTPTKVQAGQTAVVDTLKAAGVDTAAITNLVSQPLVATTGTTAGNAYDKVLDTLAAKLTSSGTTLAALTTTVAQTSAGSTSTSGTSTTTAAASLPADLLLKPKAANCSALRSGKYHLIKLAPSVPVSTTSGPVTANSPLTTIETLELDASTLTFSNPSNPADTWQLTANGNCRFGATNDALADLVVSQAGVIVARAQIGLDDTVDSGAGSTRTIIGIPAQDIPVSALAGKWNMLSWERDYGVSNPILEASAGTFDLNAAGEVVSARCFANSLLTADSACTVESGPYPRLKANAASGFDMTSTDLADPWKDRWFAYRSGTGQLMLLWLGPRGDFGFATPYRVVSLPAVGDTRTRWNHYTNVAGINSNLVDANTWTAVSVNAAAGTFVRNSFTVGQEANVQAQTVAVNSGRTGYARRLVTTGTYSSGTSYTTREFFSVDAAGMGLSVAALPQNNAPNLSNAVFVLSVHQAAP